MINSIPDYILKALDNRGDKSIDEILEGFSMTPARIKAVKQILADNNLFGLKREQENIQQGTNQFEQQVNIKEELERRIREEKIQQELEIEVAKKRAQREKEEVERRVKLEAEQSAAVSKAKHEAEQRAFAEKARIEKERQAKLEAERKAVEEKARRDKEDAERKNAQENFQRETDKRLAEEKLKLQSEFNGVTNIKNQINDEANSQDDLIKLRTINTDENIAKNIRTESENDAPKKLSWFQRRAIKKALIKKNKEAEKQAKLEAERRAAEEKARIEKERQAKLEAERKAAEEQTKREAEEKARKEKEEAERKAAEEQARKEKEEAERKAAEEKARKEKEEAERKAAEEKARIEKERQAKLEAERKAAEEQTKREAEEKARKEKENKLTEDRKKNEHRKIDSSFKLKKIKMSEINSDPNQRKISIEKEAAPQFANPFISLFNKKIDTAFGMDISDNSIELLEFSAFFKHKPRVYSRIALDDGTIVDGIIKKKDKFQEKIKELLLEAKPGKVSTNRVIISIPESQLYTWSTNIDTSLISGKLKDKIYEESKKFIPLDYRYIYWDVISYENQQKNSYSATFFAIEKKVLNKYVSSLNELGIDVVDFSLAAINVARVFLPIKKEIISAIVEIGENITNVSIFKGNRILKLFMTSPVGGDNINSEIIKNLKITELEAEDMKQKFGVNESNKPEYQNAVKNGLKTILSEIKNILDFYEEDSEEKISNVFFTGGTSLLKGLTKESENILGKNIQLLEAIPLVSDSEIFRDEINLKLFSNVLGLAISGVTQEKNIFSFKKQLEVNDFKMGFFNVLSTGYFSRNRMIFDFTHIVYAFLITIILTVSIFATIIALSIDWSVVFN